MEALRIRRRPPLIGGKYQKSHQGCTGDESDFGNVGKELETSKKFTEDTADLQLSENDVIWTISAHARRTVANELEKSQEELSIESLLKAELCKKKYIKL